MRPYFLITLDELTDSEDANYNGEELNISSIGLLFKKFVTFGYVLNKMEENNKKILKLGNESYEIYFNIGQYFNGNYEKIWDIPINSRIIISGTSSFKSKSDQKERLIFTENFRSINETEYEYFVLSAVKFLNDRVKIVSRIVSAGISTYEEILAISGSQYIADGIFHRIRGNMGFDIAKYESLVATLTSYKESTVKDIVLNIIRSRGEISLNELLREIGDRASREEIESAVIDLMSAGEITEFRRDVYKYVY